MKTCSKTLVILLRLIYITLFPVLEAEGVWAEVTGYVGHDVTLPCRSTPGPVDTITQTQWDLTPPGGGEIIIIVFNAEYGVDVHDTVLRERVAITEQSLIIRNVTLGDAGLYTCRLATYPGGPFKGTTSLVVREQTPLSSGFVSAIVIAVILLLVITAAIVYLVFIRRRDPTVRHRVYIDTHGPVMDVVRPSIIVRDEDVVYSDVKLKPSRDAKLSSTAKHTADDVTYSEVVYRQQTELDEIYARAIKV